MRARTALLIIAFMSAAVVTAEGSGTSREYPSFYKSPRAMGMGGAAVAIGGRTDTLFYNPAGLGTMPEGNWEVNLLGLSGEYGKNVKNFIDELNDAFDTGDVDGDGETDDDEFRAVNGVLAKYRGKPMHLRMADFSSFGLNTGPLAFAIGGLGSVTVDARTHQGFGSEGLLGIDANATYGGLGGLSYRVIEGLHVGGAVKYYHRESLVHDFTVRELLEKEDTLDDYITEDLRKSGNAFGFDIGAIYQLAPVAGVKPAVGLSILDIGDTDFKDAGKVPMTVNIGASASYDLPVLKSVTVGLDYVDLFGGYEQDSDMGKRLRFGAELELFDFMLAAMAVRAGLYQGEPTFGANLRLLAFDFSYTTYAEQVGAYAGQDKDRRHLFMVNVGW